MKHINTLLRLVLLALPVLIVTTTTGLFLDSELDPIRQAREAAEMKKETRARNRKAFPDERHDAGAVAHPNRDYYIFPRTFNTSVPISQGVLAAMAHRDGQLRALALRKAAIDNAWTCVGPFNSAGRMRVVRYHPTNPDILYAGAASGGVWKSTNNGASWEPLTDNFPTLAIGHIAIDPRNPETVYAGTGEGTNNADAVYGTGLYKTTDGGATWKNCNIPVSTQDQCVNYVELHPAGADTVFAAMSFGSASGALYKSLNGGATWAKVIDGPARSVLVDRAKPNRVIVAMGYYNGTSTNGIYVSDRNGDRYSFTKVSTNLPPADSIGRIVMDASPSNPGAIMCIMVTSSKRAASSGGAYPGDLDLLGIFRSTNSGDSWERMPASNNVSVKGFMRAQGDYNCFVRFHPTNHNIVYMGGIETWRSTDFGVTWTKVSNQNDAMYSTWVDMHWGEFNPVNPNQMMVCGDGGIYRTNNSTDGKPTWQEMATGLATFQFYGISVDASTPKRVLGGTQDRRNNIGQVGNSNWTRLTWGGDGGYTCFDHKLPQTYYVESQYGNIARTDNNGGSFKGITTGLERGTDNSSLMSFVAPFLMHPTDNRTLFIAGHKVYRTGNQGGQWLPISEDLTKGTYWTRQFQDLSICTQNPNVLWGVTGSTGVVFRSENVMALADNVTWANVNGTDVSQKIPALFLNAIAAHPSDPKTAYVGTSAFDPKSGVYKTTDAGATWKFMSGSTPQTSLPKVPVGAIAVWERNPEVVFVGTDVGVYVSTDGGANWRPFGEGLPTVVIDDLKITPDDILFAGTHGRGAWMASAIITVDAEAQPTARTFTLGRNYPNPVASTTTLPFTIIERTHVRLAVYDASGRCVQTLVDDVRMPGDHLVQLDAARLQPGVYFYRLETGTERMTRKLAIVR